HGRRRSQVARGFQGSRRDRSGGGAMSYRLSAIGYQVDANTQVATITLNRPERLNALTFEVYNELRDTFQRLDSEPGVRAIVIAAACDIRVAAESAKIAFLFTKVGLSGADMGAAWLLPRIVGYGHATEMLLTGDFIDAKRAYEIGLYNRVVPQAQVLPEAREIAEKRARGPSAALGVT